MWNTRARRWLGIPAVFLLVGPPAGGLALVLFMPPLVGLALVLALPGTLPLAYFFGGVQAVLAGLVAAATLHPGGGVRARPPVLAGAAVGLLIITLSAVAQEAAPEVLWPSRAEMVVSGVLNGVMMFVAHVAGAGAGVLACRWLERRWDRKMARRPG